MERELQRCREEIACVDDEIFQLIKKRFAISFRIGELKRNKKLEIINYTTEAFVLKRAEEIAKNEGLNKDLVYRIISNLIQESINIQRRYEKKHDEYLYSIFEKVEALKAQGTKLIRFDVGEPDLPAPLMVKEALCNSLYNTNHIGYVSSKGLPELRKAIASALNDRYNTDLNADQVLITPGGKFAIFSAIFAMVSQSDRVLIPEPTWPVYGNVTQLAGGREDILHTFLEKDWDIDFNKLLEMLQVHPKLLVLCTPNNPSGKIFSENSLKEIVEAASKVGCYTLSDEVYESYSSVPTKSILQVANSHFIYVNTLSKRYGMTGWRIGYAVSDRKTIDRMQSILQLSITCVPEFIQKAALSALTMEQGVFNEYANEMRERLNLVCNRLKKLPVKYFRPRGGMYVFPKVTMNGFDSVTFANKLLENRRIAVTPGNAFGNYPEHFRISLGTNKEEIKEGIKGIT